MVIFEPHGDDALLSASSLLSSCTAVYTLFNDRSSDRLREFFPHLSIVNLNIDCKSGLQYADRPSASIVSTNFTASGDFWAAYRDYVAQQNKDIIQTVVDTLKDSLQGQTIVTTLGLIHPQHITARIITEALTEDVYYMAEPAVRFRRVGQLAERMALANSQIQSEFSLPSIENKMAIFKRCYPTESYLIRDKTLENDMVQKEIFWRKV